MIWTNNDKLFARLAHLKLDGGADPELASPFDVAICEQIAAGWRAAAQHMLETEVRRLQAAKYRRYFVRMIWITAALQVVWTAVVLWVLNR